MRLWEMDFLRGVSLVLMVFFNYSVTLEYFRIFDISDAWMYDWLFPRLIASSFILVAGVSLWLSWSRRPSCKRLAFRGAKIFGYGILVTAITWLFFPSYVILFGILHLIGLSIVLSMPFLKRINLVLPAIAVTLISGIYFGLQSFGFSGGFWLFPQYFQTFDYFPLLPWFGVFLLGVFIGSNLYGEGKRKYSIREAPPAAKSFMLLGRRSLFIYLIHQPALLAVLYLSGFI
ncbi:MAG: DUF1624 domain-containing protein [Candidatus Aenigmarchaeota archaeon]|nr:DUF1624 domain-containing protein [Candidatus Aenigmarchaeota archaeon]